MTGYTVNYDSSINDVAFNDLYLDSNGNLAYIATGDAEVEETCNHAVQLTEGDYNLDTTLGIPYNEYLSSDSPIGVQLKRSIIKSILAVNGTDSIMNFAIALDPTTRKLQLGLIIKLLSSEQISINL